MIHTKPRETNEADTNPRTLSPFESLIAADIALEVVHGGCPLASAHDLADRLGPDVAAAVHRMVPLQERLDAIRERAERLADN